MNELMKTGSTQGYLDAGKMMPFDEFNKLIGLPELRYAERKYSSGRDISDEVN
jgi:hypothetical protein